MKQVFGVSLFILAVSFGTRGFATDIVNCPDRYPNGNRLVDGDVLRFPNGNRLKDGDVWRYPNGNRVVDGDVWRYSNGNRIVDGDVWRYENGNRFRDGDVLRYKNGNRLREPDGTFRAEDGTRIGGTGVTLTEIMSSYGFVKFYARQRSESLGVTVAYDGANSFELIYSGSAQPDSIICSVETGLPTTSFRLVHPKAILNVDVTHGVDAAALKKKLLDVLNGL